jgi:hypothetical protein
MRKNDSRRHGGMRKQRMSIHDIWRKLEREVHKVSFLLVSLSIGGIQRKLYMAVFTLCHN